MLILPDFAYFTTLRLADEVERTTKCLLANTGGAYSQSSVEALRAALDNYLNQVWTSGSLQGHSAQEAFSVRVGVPETMSEKEAASGLWRIEVGIAMARPNELFAVKVEQKAGA